MGTAYETFEKELGGMKFRVDFCYDEDMGEPWKEHDGHGIVSEWTTRSKAPGERVLCKDRDSRRYYDVQATMEKAEKEGWGIENPEGKTKGQILAEAVDRDFKYLKGWCNDEWHWTTVRVRLLDVDGNPTNEWETCGGIESSDEKYLKEVAGELAAEIAHRVPENGTLCVQVRKSGADDHKAIAAAVAAYYSRKLKGNVWCSYDSERKRYEIRGEGIPAHPDLAAQYPNGVSILDYVTVAKAKNIAIHS